MKKTGNIKEKIEEKMGRYLFYSSEASKIARQLAFTQGAIFWIIYSNMDCNQPKLLLGIFYTVLILFFICDLIQYLHGAYKFEQLAMTLKNIKEKNKLKLNYEDPDYFVQSIKMFFSIKFIFLSISFLLLIVMFTIFIISD